MFCPEGVNVDLYKKGIPLNEREVDVLEIGRKKKTKYRAKTLMEQDFLRDVLINNKDMNLKDYSNNKSAYNMSLNSINYNSLNNRQQGRSTNYSPSIKEIMKNPTQKQDINFNININMNNNYKKLIYHYHGHNNSSINNSYVNKNERNSHLSFNPIMKKRDIFGKEKEFYKKRNSNDINSNELKLNKNHEINNKDGSKYNSCFCAIFENTQLLLIETMAISWILSLVYPFIICFLTTIFRRGSLTCGKNGISCCYKINKILQLI
jgi:hypothetical protein